MARKTKAKPFLFITIGCGADRNEMSDHFADEDNEGFARRLKFEQPLEVGISYAFFRQNFSVQRSFGREMAEQQPFRNTGGGRHLFRRGAGESVLRETLLRRVQNLPPARIAAHTLECHGTK